MNHANVVHAVVVGLQEAFQQDQVHTETSAVVQAPVDYVANAIQNTQQHLSTQLQQMQAMMQSMQIKYDAAPHDTHQEYGGSQYCEGRVYHVNQSSYRVQGGRGTQNNGNWRVVRGG